LAPKFRRYWTTAAAIMQTTSVSLLERLRQPADQLAWTRFVDLYTPLLLQWARRAGLQESDAADLIQDVFQLLLRKLPEFAYDQQKSFRGWLRTVLLNQWRTRLRRRTEQPLDEAGAVEPAGEDGLAEEEYRNYLVGRALQIMQRDFQPATWQACWEHVGRGRPAAEVAAELGLTVKAVYLAKARVLRRLRQELDGLCD
jgi:RNA polymerase sigma-70 factor, ECF subfamily